MTNLGKLVGWDIDYYLSLSEDECLICLSERDRYALGQALMQMRWSTRWNSDIDTPLPDINAIASRLDDKMSDESCIDLCQMISDCIAGNQTIQQQISFYSGYPSITAETEEVADYLMTDLLEGQGVVSCDINSIFGATTQLTDFLNMLSVDLLEIFTGAFAVPERLADVISAIPVVETLPLDEILEFTAKMAQQIENSYNSAYDSQIRDDFRCDLRCLVIENDCQLSLELARNYFYDKLETAITKTDFLQIVNDIIANNWLGEQSIYLLHFMILQTIIFGGEILGIDVNRIARQVATFFNDPDSDWEVLCDDCPDYWTSVIDFSNAQYFSHFLQSVAWTPREWGVYDGGDGQWEATNATSTFNNVKGISIGITFDPVVVQSVRIEYDAVRGNWAGHSSDENYIQLTQYPSDTIETGVMIDNLVTGNDQQKIYDVITINPVDFLVLNIRCDISTKPTSAIGTLNLKRVIINGTGTKPPQLP